ncbi:MAG: hypothetical protein WA906_13450 [Pacificimonas sp.]
MEGQGFLFAPPLPLAALAVGLLLSLIPIGLALRFATSRAAQFLILAIGLRIMFDAATVFTLRPLVAGLTPNALLSIATVGIGCLLIERVQLRLAALVPLYLLIAAILMSAAFNGPDVAMLQVLVKLAYFAVLLVVALQALSGPNGGRLPMLIVAAFSPALILQLISIATGVANTSPTDGSRAFIGGFNHESIFALVVGTQLLVLTLAKDIGRGARVGLLAILLVSLFLANYRTVIIGLAPLLLVEAFALAAGAVPRRQRALPFLAAFGMAAVLIGNIAINPGERFEAAAQMVANPGELIRPPEQFTREERRFASARSYVWSQYWYGFTRAGPTEQVFGHGADSWQDDFKVYAQNTFLSYLYEFGVFGAFAVAALLIAMAIAAVKASGGMAARLLAAHAGFLLINLSTMPFWIIEGLLFYALLCALTLHYAYRASAVRSRAPLTGAMAA